MVKDDHSDNPQPSDSAGSRVDEWHFAFGLADNAWVTTWDPDDPWKPGNPQNRERTRVLQRELRERLLRWDPIGVSDAPEAQDEYDCLLSPLMHKLHDRQSAEAIEHWLGSELQDHFGLPTSPPREKALASELILWWSAATTQ
jgi:hypothetical protein